MQVNGLKIFLCTLREIYLSENLISGLVIDGGLSFPFNDGTEAFLEIRPEDSLKTITLED